MHRRAELLLLDEARGVSAVGVGVGVAILGVAASVGDRSHPLACVGLVLVVARDGLLHCRKIEYRSSLRFLFASKKVRWVEQVGSTGSTRDLCTGSLRLPGL